MKIKTSKSMIAFQSIACVLLTFGAVICVLPFVIILSGSLTDDAIIIKEGYSILPKGFTFEAYKTIFKVPGEILQAYKMTIFYTAVGTSLGLMMITMTSYVISRKEFKYRDQVSFLIYFTTLFGGCAEYEGHHISHLVSGTHEPFSDHSHENLYLRECAGCHHGIRKAGRGGASHHLWQDYSSGAGARTCHRGTVPGSGVLERLVPLFHVFHQPGDLGAAVLSL